MEGENANAAPNPAEQAGQPEFKVPDGKVLLDASEHQRLQQRVSGMQGYYEAGRKHGFGEPNAFERYGRFNEKLSSRGLSLDALERLLDDPSPAAGEDSAFDFSKLETTFLKKDEFGKEIDTRLSKMRAEMEHKSLLEKQDALFKSRLSETLKGVEDENEKWLIENAAERLLEQTRYSNEFLYPEDHPLAGQDARPLDEKAIGKVFDDLQKRIRREKAEQLADVGRAAAKPAKTPASAGRGEGGVKPETDSDPRAELRARMERRAKELRDQAMRGAVGSR